MHRYLQMASSPQSSCGDTPTTIVHATNAFERRERESKTRLYLLAAKACQGTFKPLPSAARFKVQAKGSAAKESPHLELSAK